MIIIIIANLSTLVYCGLCEPVLFSCIMKAGLKKRKKSCSSCISDVWRKVIYPRVNWVISTACIFLKTPIMYMKIVNKNCIFLSQTPIMCMKIVRMMVGRVSNFSHHNLSSWQRPATSTLFCGC